MVLWIMSDRAIPRSFRMMEGFGIHTFRLVNAQGVARFVKFHWKPALGMHSLVWDEAQKLGGKDPDWLRRDLWDAIAMGAYPEWELGLQVLEEADEFKFPFDILDPTKIWPEELVPVRRVGRMTLDRNPDNFFAETEQVAFHPGKGACSPTWTRSSRAWAALTSPRFPSTAPSRRCTTTSATGTCSSRSIRARPATSPTRSAAAAP